MTSCFGFVSWYCQHFLISNIFELVVLLQDPGCWLCKKCLATEEMTYLRMAFLEHANRHQARRVYPRQTSQEEAKALIASSEKGAVPQGDRSVSNQKMHQV